jgi:hypothetical protein
MIADFINSDFNNEINPSNYLFTGYNTHKLVKCVCPCVAKL